MPCDGGRRGDDAGGRGGAVPPPRAEPGRAAGGDVGAARRGPGGDGHAAQPARQAAGAHPPPPLPWEGGHLLAHLHPSGGGLSHGAVVSAATPRLRSPANPRRLGSSRTAPSCPPMTAAALPLKRRHAICTKQQSPHAPDLPPAHHWVSSRRLHHPPSHAAVPSRPTPYYILVNKLRIPGSFSILLPSSLFISILFFYSLHLKCLPGENNPIQVGRGRRPKFMET